MATWAERGRIIPTVKRKLRSTNVRGPQRDVIARVLKSTNGDGLLTAALLEIGKWP